MMHHGRRRLLCNLLYNLLVALLVAAVTVVAGSAATQPARAALGFEVENLDGSGNNQAHPEWGQAGRPYARVAPARYADGRSQPVAGPNTRFISNREFNDISQNIFSERGVSQWGNVWGQFLDHTFGLRDGNGEAANIAFNSGDPLESFTNTLGAIPFTRSAAAPGTGVSNPREQVNTTPTYVNAFAVYGGTAQRLEWLRDGPVDGNMANNDATLMLPGGYLPRRDTRGDAASAPPADVDGRLLAQPTRAAVAGDVRANENIALTATHTLFAREHNRIVSLLPSSLTQEEKFQIARRVIRGEQQYITYNEFLPAMGIQLPAYSGYNPNVNATESNEFATVGYRAHSQIHGEVEAESEAGRWSQAQLDAFRAQGIEVADEGGEVALTIPLNVAFFNPDLVPQIQLGPLLEGIGGESEYKNDEMIDNQLRSVLFQVPVSGNPACLDGPGLPECFRGVVDLAAIDIERGRDHGMPSYNQLRQAYGLAPRASFTAITGEASDQFPSDPQLTPGNEVNDPNSLDFTNLFDVTNDTVAADNAAEVENSVTRATRRTPLAARLRAIYGSVANVDAFAGMVAEPHQPGSEFGELQRAIWTRQFQAFRDGDRFFYQNDPALTMIRQTYNVDFRRSLAQVIASNTDIPLSDLAPNVFFTHGDVPLQSCRVTYTITTQWPGNFQVNMRIANTGATPTQARWTLKFSFPNGQVITQLWNGVATQSDRKVAVGNNLDSNANGTIPAGGSIDGVGFNATRNDSAPNGTPTNFTLNSTACSSG
jgi:Animal haem peroxidase/Cellulose binding domain